MLANACWSGWEFGRKWDPEEEEAWSWWQWELTGRESEFKVQELRG